MKRYYVMTWDTEKQAFTPQAGVRVGPYTLFGLRKALRKLRLKGYPCDRNDPAVRVEDQKNYDFERVKPEPSLFGSPP